MTHITTIFFRQKPSAIFLALLLLASVLSSIYAVHLGSAIRYPDEAEYLSLASSLTRTGQYSLDGVNPTAYRPPGYPLMLATGLKIGLPVTGLRIINALTLPLCMLLVFLLLRRKSLHWALLSALLLLCYPVLFYTAGTFYPQIPGAVLLLGAVLALFSHSQTPTLSRFLTSGLAFGAALLMVPTFGFVVLLTIAFLVAQTPRRKFLIGSVVLICGVAIVLAPWMARNAIVFNRLIPLSTNNGINLLLGNNENATPDSGTTADVSAYLEGARGLSEIQANDYFTQAAIAYIRNNPGHAAKLYTGKLANYFNYENRLHTKGESSTMRSLVMLFSYGAILALALLRILMARRHPLSRLELYIAWIYLMNAPLAAAFFTRIRFRLPLDMLLIMLSAAAILIICRHWTSSRMTEQEK